MLVVVAIIIILAGAATPLVLNYLAQARVDRAKMDIKKIETAVGNYYSRHNVYPDNLQALTQPDENGVSGMLSQQDLLDPWNQPYEYNPGQMTSRGVPMISSRGPQGNAQNINNEVNSIK
jgi:general secretion pathway protein G